MTKLHCPNCTTPDNMEETSCTQVEDTLIEVGKHCSSCGTQWTEAFVYDGYEIEDGIIGVAKEKNSMNSNETLNWEKALEDYQELMHTNRPKSADAEMAAIAQTIQDEEVEFGKTLLGFLEEEKGETK